jgi:hypothetical protein
VNEISPTGRNTGYPRRSGYARVDKDWYVEPRWLVHQLLDVETFKGTILDPCCGGGTIPSVCLERGLVATGSDVVDRGFGEVRNLFTITDQVDNIISNVPYRLAEPCALHMLRLARCKVALILPMTFWEAERRDKFFRKHPPARWWACASRPSMPPGQMTGERDRHGALIQPPSCGGTMPYGWFIWEIGFRGTTSAMRLPLREREGDAQVARPFAGRLPIGSKRGINWLKSHQL